jgi:hypothetical protein
MTFHAVTRCGSSRNASHLSAPSTGRHRVLPDPGLIRSSPTAVLTWVRAEAGDLSVPRTLAEDGVWRRQKHQRAVYLDTRVSTYDTSTPGMQPMSRPPSAHVMLSPLLRPSD